MTPLVRRYVKTSFGFLVLGLLIGGWIIVGEFVERQREDYLTLMRRQLGTHFHELPPQPTEDGTDEECCSSC